jgi:hypothetical protein
MGKIPGSGHVERSNEALTQLGNQLNTRFPQAPVRVLGSGCIEPVKRVSPLYLDN